MSGPTVRHVLLDADGVLQRHPVPPVDVVRRVLGSGASERLAASRRLRRASARLHRAVWLTIATDPEVVAVVGELRERGTRVHLATNQRRVRADHMREHLGYEDVFDSCWYSADVGVEKPDPAYFTAVLAGLGAQPGECLLVDDRTPNLRAARGLGMQAELWTTRHGTAALRKGLARHGVLPPQ